MILMHFPGCEEKGYAAMRVKHLQTKIPINAIAPVDLRELAMTVFVTFAVKKKMIANHEKTGDSAWSVSKGKLSMKNERQKMLKYAINID
jgi:hypothetical protein